VNLDKSFSGDILSTIDREWEDSWVWVVVVALGCLRVLALGSGK
jgi:hypothetical protein